MNQMKISNRIDASVLLRSDSTWLGCGNCHGGLESTTKQAGVSYGDTMSISLECSAADQGGERTT